MIRRNIDLETRLIDDLLDLSRVITGKLRLDRRPTPLNDLVRHVLDIVGGEVHDKGLIVETDLAARSDLVDVDPARLQQVIWNLVKNAAKFTASGGTIHVATRPAGSHRVEVEVRDTGKGINPEALAVYLRRLRAGRPGDHPGVRRTGSGPVDRQGGGQPARGDDPCGERRAGPWLLLHGDASRCCRSRARAATTPARRRPRSPSPGGSACSSSRTTSTRPERWSSCWSVRATRSTGPIAWPRRWNSPRDRPFDVIVSDLGLPDGSGYELMRALQDRYGARGIALSGFGMEGDILRGREAGFLEHLVKPVDVATLDQAILRVARLHPQG